MEIAEKTVKLLLFPGVVLYFFIFVLASFVSIDVITGPFIQLWSFSKLWPSKLVWFRSTIVSIWMSIIILHFEYFSRLKIVITGDAFRENESALVVSNHTTWTDSVIMFSLARQVARHGDVKFFAKKSLLFFPVFGVASFFLQLVIFISREFSRAQRGLSKTFSILTDPKRKLNFWLVSYLEGTRITRPKLEASRSFAKQRDLKPLDHVLQPRTKGFVASVQELRGVATCLYDITIGYEVDEELAPTPAFLDTLFTTSLKGERVVHVHQRRILISQLPSEDAALKQWTYRLYEEKDELLKEFHKNGKFRGPSVRWKKMTSCYAAICLIAFWTFSGLLMSLLFVVGRLAFAP